MTDTSPELGTVLVHTPHGPGTVRRRWTDPDLGPRVLAELADGTSVEIAGAPDPSRAETARADGDMTAEHGIL